MRGIFIVFTLCFHLTFNRVESIENPEFARKGPGTERERAIEELLRNSFKESANLASLGNFSVNPGNGVLRVKQIVNNMVVNGLSKAVRTPQADLKAGTIFLISEVKRLTAHVDYELDGYCLFLPIWGKGKAVVIMDDVRITAKATLKLVRDKIKITSTKITFDMSDGSFDLSSLFGESQPGFLTPLYVKVFNANSRYIFNEILPSYIPQSEEALFNFWGAAFEKV
ncbi:hypothetical protein WA026_000409 [Henosepilachna vigintioctopunctata]|uniref:Uncharacterized protein n=1 Tax=Henosepilachna vigintioctopunctata TaxID=420089 RepID=A0AAW1V5P3_9CUCU